MGALIVGALKTVLLSFCTEKVFKEVIRICLKEYTEWTDNDIDDQIYAARYKNKNELKEKGNA